MIEGDDTHCYELTISTGESFTRTKAMIPIPYSDISVVTMRTQLSFVVYVSLGGIIFTFTFLQAVNTNNELLFFLVV